MIRALLLSLLAGAATPSEEARWFSGTGIRDEGSGQDEVPRFATGEEQLAHARRQKLVFYRSPAVRREASFRRTIQAYAAVELWHADDERASSEAAFRIGELCRAAGDAARAQDAFLRALEHGARPFDARALLELGHLERRRGAWEEALGRYLEVTSRPGTATHRRDEAWLWAGKAWMALKSPGDARRAWRNVAVSGSRPWDRVRAYDWIGLTWVAEEDLEAAAGVLHECLQALGGLSREKTRTGERVRTSLESMRLVRELRRSVQQRLENADPHGRENPLRRGSAPFSSGLFSESGPRGASERFQSRR